MTDRERMEEIIKEIMENVEIVEIVADTKYLACDETVREDGVNLKGKSVDEIVSIIEAYTKKIATHYSNGECCAPHEVSIRLIAVCEDGEEEEIYETYNFDEVEFCITNGHHPLRVAYSVMLDDGYTDVFSEIIYEYDSIVDAENRAYQTLLAEAKERDDATVTEYFDYIDEWDISKYAFEVKYEDIPTVFKHCRFEVVDAVD